MNMSFEQLPDEVLLIICSYLNPYSILKGLNDLNCRLNRTIDQYRKHLDLRNLTLGEFYFFCQLIKLSFGNQIRSLILSNAAPSVRQLILFRKQIEPMREILSNLECLTLIDHYDDELDLYLPLISTFKYLKELKIQFLTNKNSTSLVTLLPQMLTDNFLLFNHQFPKRRKSQLLILEKLSFIGTGYLKLTSLFNETITYLTIEIENTDDLKEIFSGFNSLQYLNVNMKQLTVMTSHCYTILPTERKVQCLSLINFHCQAQWQPEILSFDQFLSIIMSMPNVQHCSCTLMTEMKKEKLTDSDYINIDKWRNLCLELIHLLHFDCSIKCPLKSSFCSEIDFIRILATISPTPDRSINIQFDQNNELNHHPKSDSILEVDIQELHQMNGTQLAKKLIHSQELTLYSDLFVDDEQIFSTFPKSLLLPDHLIFPRIRSLDLLGEYPNMNNIFLIQFVEQILPRSPNLQSIGFFLYWVENMTELVLNFLRPLQNYLKQITKCYLYTEGDIDQNFVSEFGQLLSSLTLLSVKIDWYCNTADVVNLILLHMKHLNHLELVLEEIPDYFDEDYINRIRIEKELESVALERDAREWLKRNTILGKKTSKKIFRAEKCGNDLKIWL